MRPCEDDERPVWIARALSDPNCDLERPNSINIQYYRPTSRDASIQRCYTSWDSIGGLQWKIDDEQLPQWESTESLLTAWKLRVRQDSMRHTMKIPRTQVQIIQESLLKDIDLQSSQ